IVAVAIFADFFSRKENCFLENASNAIWDAWRAAGGVARWGHIALASSGNALWSACLLGHDYISNADLAQNAAPGHNVVSRRRVSRARGPATGRKRAIKIQKSICRDSCQKQTSGNDGLLRCLSRFFDQCCHLGCVRKKDCVAARKFNDLRLRPLR